ncbi:unnamed protein product [Mytilus edulis]|uniref:Reverse transcriptase domain-containing protein n=1 Tax=Mytilus edulis TaxID=6550 RepID=A0A8S3U8D2_MYTED|nr:unnamed protein product [Mytilus edulis]
MNLIRAQHEARNKNHKFSEISKCSRPSRPIPDITIGDLVYFYTDRSKTQSRDRYLVVARDGEWCFIKKFSGNQLRASSYIVKLSECYKVLNTISVQRNPRYSQKVYNQESDSDDHDKDSLPGPIRDLPPDRAEPPPFLICENIDDVENLNEPTGQPDNSLEHDLTLSNSSNEQDNKRVLRYHLEFECEPCGKCSRKEIKFNESEQIVIDNLLTKFLHKKVIEPVIHQYGEVLFSILIRPKADGSFRLILNLRNLNEHLEYKHFKMETFKSALELVKNENFFAKLDIKDAYYSLGIKKVDRKFLRFTWKGQLYQFTAMPNGLSPAPRIFTKLLKPVLSSLRKEGYVNCAYIDDILLVGDTYEECLNNVQETMKLFDSLGFTIH